MTTVTPNSQARYIVSENGDGVSVRRDGYKASFKTAEEIDNAPQGTVTKLTGKRAIRAAEIIAKHSAQAVRDQKTVEDIVNRRHLTN